MITVKNLTKRYGSHIAVNDLSFEVEKGQIYGFLGPNGAGKSTTMNIITGYLAASEGTVLIDGIDIQKEPEKAKKKIGYLPELPPLYLDMTVGEYLDFAADLKKLPSKEKKESIQKAMEMTGIADMKGRLIKNLSKGYKQRVGLAQAILGEPEIIILDEPSVGLDPKQIIEIRELIKKLGEKHTVILSSHILSEVSAVCDHVMIIAHGQLVASDSPANLQAQMEGAMELSLVVKDGGRDLTAVLAGLDGVETVEKKNCTEAGCSAWQITAKKGADIRENLFFTLAGLRVPILELNRRERSLEDIFLELTGDVAPVEKQKKRFGRKKKGAAEANETTPNITEAVEEATEAAAEAQEVAEAAPETEKKEEEN